MNLAEALDELNNGMIVKNNTEDNDAGVHMSPKNWIIKMKKLN